MDRPVPKALSRAAIIVAVILVGYFILSALSLAIPSGNWILILLTVLLVLAIGIPFMDKAFGDKLPFLRSWPSPSTNAKIRRILSAGGSNSSYNMWKASTKKDFIVSTLISFAPFLILTAIGGVLSLFKPVSPAYFRIALYTLIACAIVPGSFGVGFRLRKRYSLKSALIAIGLFSPINALLIFATFSLLMILQGNSLSVSADLMPLICGFSIFFTAIMTLLFSTARDMPAPPEFTYRLSYVRAEYAASTASYAAILLVFLLSR